MRRRLQFILPPLIIVVGIIAARAIITARPKPEVRPVEVQVPRVRVLPVHAQSYQLRVHSQGTVVPRTEITLVAEVTGRVVEVSPSFEVGGFFRADEPLATIDPRDYELALVRTQTQVRQAELRLQTEQASAEVARGEWEDLGEGNGTPLALREPQVAEAEASLEAARAAHEQARRDLDRTRVSAPFTGRVRRKAADIGQFVTRGQMVAMVYAVDYAEIRLPLSTEELGFAEIPWGYRDTSESAMAPEVRVTASLGGTSYTWIGHIVRAEGEVDPQSRLLYAVARVDDPYGLNAEDDERPPLAVGLFVEADITGKRLDDVFVIPRSAVRGRDRVLVVDDEDRLEMRTLLVVRAERDVVIVRTGLLEGERLCLTALDNPVSGMRVQPLSESDLDRRPSGLGSDG